MADVEKERTMIELELNETISRNKTNTTEKIARLAQAEERIVVLNSKLKQKSADYDSLLTAVEQDRAGEPLTLLLYPSLPILPPVTTLSSPCPSYHPLSLPSQTRRLKMPR